jgi:hypothetical protein
MERLFEFLEQERASPSPPAASRPFRRVPLWIWPCVAAGATLVGVVVWISSGSGRAKSDENSAVAVSASERPAAPERIAAAAAPLVQNETKPSTPLKSAPSNSTPPNTDSQSEKAATDDKSSTQTAHQTEVPLPSAGTAATKPEIPADSKKPGETAAPDESEKPTQLRANNDTRPEPPALFNGTDLTGWNDPTGCWRVEQGTIVGSVPAGRMCLAVLRSKQKYKAFDLKFRVRLKAGSGNSGVHFRSNIQDPASGSVAGPQCVILRKDDDRNYRTGSLVNERAGKLDVVEAPAKAARFIKQGEFNQVQIRCEGKNVVIRVNHMTMVSKTLTAMPEEGLIALVLDGRRQPGEVTFKDLKFTDLSRSGPANGIARSAAGSNRLVKAEAHYVQSVEKAKKNLLTQFDSRIKQRSSGKHGSDEHSAEIATLEQEKEAFEKKGRIPWSRLMRSAMFDYLKDLESAQQRMEKAFDTEIEQAQKRGDERAVAELQEADNSLLAPHLVALASFEESQFRFRSDGILDEPGDATGDNVRRWWLSLHEHDAIVIEEPSEEQPGSFVTKELPIAGDGKSVAETTPDGEEHVWQFVDE